MTENSDSLSYLKNQVVSFRDKRNWLMYHKPKDLAISILLEASELLELFQWRSEDEIEKLITKKEFIQHIAREMADILIYLLSLADVLNIDLGEAVIQKLRENDAKYPPEKVSGEKFKEILDRYLNL